MYLIRHPKTETLLFLESDPRPAGFAGEVTEDVTLEDLTGGDNMGFLSGGEINPFWAVRRKTPANTASSSPRRIAWPTTSIPSKSPSKRPRASRTFEP